MSSLSSSRGAADDELSEEYPQYSNYPSRRRPSLLGRMIGGIFRWFASLFRFILATALFFVLMVAASYWLVNSSIRGKELVTPDVMRLSMWDAAKKLKEDKLSLEWDRDQPNETVPKGNIVSQYPAPGTRIKAGSAMRVVTSAGTPELTVPNLRGATRKQAEITLHNQGLKIGNIMAISDPKKAPGMVVETDPPAGTGVVSGAKVNLAVVTGANQAPQAMPNLYGMTLDQARETLGKYNLTISEDRRAASDQVAPGQIHAQKPAPGEPVTEATRVSVTYAPNEDEGKDVTPDTPEEGQAELGGAEDKAPQGTPPPVVLN